MIHNDVLRSIRYMLNIPETKLLEIIALGGGQTTPELLMSFLKREDEVGFVACPDRVMSHFLDGLIIFRRGKDESKTLPPPETNITNNIVLKKLRVAFQLKDTDIITLIKKSGLEVTKAELGAFFRRPDHRNYRDCGDQFLRNLLKGLTP
jgi:uncharacterized protein YehS (DUF1456 family)